ncbi:TadE/TadG family type IV pilus assembly protein [Roseovarius aestuarii]|uniref:TadE-like protein n=1 Tax=Roseovarius aestuarii TaxID=475083 RepID=A0A1X7BST9_9RHOB|nr:TadE/TadG family type IV pilus assembly protein [Roseovarius aestuarii]SMC12590.1 TadE-like protein [Roseovarius aestuarii]
MRHLLGKYLRRFRRSEDGNASVEFIIIAPLFITLVTMSIELGFVTIRHTMLERGLDIAVRQIRLGTGDPGNHDQIKQVICDNSVGVLLDCDGQLRLEMQPVDPRAYATLDATPKCVENAHSVDPVDYDTDFTSGTANELMVLRACYRYDPIFPTEVMGSAMTKDDDGKPFIVSTTAFVQEPL